MELARELEAKTEIIRKLSVTNTELAEELSGAMEAARATGKENANLKRARTREARESAKAEQIEAGHRALEEAPPEDESVELPSGRPELADDREGPELDGRRRGRPGQGVL
jgi:hypothetical protein